MRTWHFSCLAILLLASFSVDAQQPKSFRIDSPSFEMATGIPREFSYRSGNNNPPFVISGIPQDAKSLAMIVEDPDSPSGLWTHWLLANIPSTIKGINKGQVPEDAVCGRNSFGNSKYDGPVPPRGTHRYYFRLFALDTTLSLKPGFTRGQLEAAMKGHIIAQAETMGTYSAGN